MNIEPRIEKFAGYLLGEVNSCGKTNPLHFEPPCNKISTETVGKRRFFNHKLFRTNLENQRNNTLYIPDV